MVEIIDLKMTQRCPSAWEGRTSDGQFIYAVYRYSVLMVGIGPTLNQAIEDGYHGGYLRGTDKNRGRELYHRATRSRALDSIMSTDELLQILRDANVADGSMIETGVQN